LLAVIASVFLSAWWTGGASAAAGQGTVEICKKGAGGVTFTFTVVKGLQTPQTVTAIGNGGCVPVTVPTGTITITEDTTGDNGLNYNQTGATTVPAGALFSENAAAAKTKVTVNAGDDIFVNITNTLAATGVKVCKTSATTQFNHAEYAFTIAGTPVTAFANGACSQVVDVQAGSVITVAETTPAGQQVTGVTAIGGTIRRNNGSSIRYVVGNGVNVVTFNNEPIGPPQTGLLEICKDAGDGFITGTYQYSIQDGNQTYQASVDVGQCTAPINHGIPAGTVTITETIPANQSLTNVFLGLNSAGQLGTVTKLNGTAVVVVPVADSGDVQVHFVNSTNVTQLKVCKFLPAGSEALQKTRFTFDVSDDQFAPGTSYTTSVSVPAGASSACTIVTSNGVVVAFPIGSKASVTERNTRPFVDAGSGLGQPDTESVRIAAGINQINFTNVAYGQLEICKYIVSSDPDYGNTFTFTYQNTADRSVKGTVTTTSGTCSFPRPVPAGTYTVTEDLSKMNVTVGGVTLPIYSFVGSDARGPNGESRCVPPATYPQPGPPNAPAPPPGTGCGNPLTVTVPFINPTDPSTGETQISFWNQLNRTSFKICKAIDSHASAALGSLDYTFTATSTVNGVKATYGPYTTNHLLGYPQCSGLMGNIPFANADGSPTTITVTETTSFSGAPTIVVQNGHVVSQSATLQTVTFNPTGNPAIATFTNGQPGLLCFSGEQDAAFADPSQWPNSAAGPPGGRCEIRPDGQSADIDTTSAVCTPAQLAPFDPQHPTTTGAGCYAGVYSLSEPLMGEPLAAIHNLHFSYTYTPGNVTGGSPRFSLFFDTTGDGNWDDYAFIDAPTCDNEHTGTVDPINDPTCSIALASGPIYPNWAAFLTAHPTAQGATNQVSFVIADQPFKGVFSNVAFGP